MRTRSTYLALTAVISASAMLTGCVTIVVPTPSTSSTAGGQQGTAPAPVPVPPTVAQSSASRNPVLDTDPPVDGVVNDLVLPDLPSLPTGKITVNITGGPTGVPTIQKLADDIAAGNVDKIVQNCWTQPESEVRQVYGSAAMRGAILQALTQVPGVAQGGVSWQGKHVEVLAYWEEFNSSYPCPMIIWGPSSAPVWQWTGLGTFTPTMAKWRMTRILAVHDGAPIQSGDGTDYTLICNADCAMWNPHSTNQIFDATPPIMSATPAQWERLRALNADQIVVEHIASDYFRVRSADGSTDAVAYFTAGYTDYWLPYVLGEIA